MTCAKPVSRKKGAYPSLTANVGLADAFIGLGSPREASEVLTALRRARPDLSGPVAERPATARRRASCG